MSNATMSTANETESLEQLDALADALRSEGLDECEDNACDGCPWCDAMGYTCER